MGIENLFQTFKPQAKSIPPNSLAGTTIGIDAPNYLHLLARRHSLALANNDPSQLIVDVIASLKALKRRTRCAKIIIVFDGLAVPLKADEAAMRSHDRERAKSLAKALLLAAEKLNQQQPRSAKNTQQQQGAALGNQPQAAAPNIHPSDITLLAAEVLGHGISLGRHCPAIAAALQQHIPEAVDVVMIAPMEAEAQLAYLAHKGIVDHVLSNDSDLILFKCPSILRDVKKSMPSIQLRLPRGTWRQLPPSLGGFRALDDVALLCLTCALSKSDYTPMNLAGRVGIANVARFVAAAAARASTSNTMFTC